MRWVSTRISASTIGPGSGGRPWRSIWRRKVIAGYERRLDVEVTHPVFGYTVTYRRVYEVQTRLLGAALLGEVPEYTAFVTR
jgi:CRISPR/Cas system-associated endonuclease Cas1